MGATDRSSIASDDIVRVHAIVTGLVQGVGFRYFAVTKARAIGVTGWVRNRYDGSVEAEAQGARADVERFMACLQSGPRFSRVAHVAVTDIAVRDDDPRSFRVFA
ncbi:acylphosphatase [Bifidobacterium aerophilum]|uniref:Acylphosphatase n=1 Tax=Bifidobacterium aerophilum TaxID=1798155 RepID=A0A6N9Z1N8_9BIFI|nr:acylphosphatase [Bifidobacterium aerophilum]NEG88462.1 acylphosphatase [Bifidobacterium aerophilum]